MKIIINFILWITFFMSGYAILYIGLGLHIAVIGVVTIVVVRRLILHAPATAATWASDWRLIHNFLITNIYN
jgi:hypothetical protein